MVIAEELGEYVKDAQKIPENTRNLVIDAIFDLVTAAIAGFGTRGGRAASQAAMAIWGSGPATCWFSSARLTVPGAAFTNSAIASMLDLDDG
ncbi:MAG: MmgE/PrpD family protein, partial [Rhodospirillales bacterium]|nr:MmgE/PrpD family protein [Rhodospirillales bacterium]